VSAVDSKLSRLTQALLLLLVIGVWALVLLLWFPRARFAANSSGTKKFDVVNVERINVVDADGKPRLVISNAARFPDPVVRGKSVKRSIGDTAGMLFYEADGNETGGLAIAKAPGDRRMVALIFDYTHQPTDGVGIFKFESADGKTYSGGLSVYDRRPYKAGEIESSQGVERAKLETKDGDAELVISDTEGKARIVLGVDRANTARLEIRDAEGNVQHRYPQ
jgi:hypothetical protein